MSDLGAPGGVQPGATGDNLQIPTEIGTPPLVQPPAGPQMVLLSGSRLPNDGGTVVGSSAFLRHLETGVDGVTQFQLGNTAVSVVQPDGSVYSGVSPVIAIGTQAPPAAELRAVWTPRVGGMHRVVWSFEVGGLPLERSETYFVSWTDMGAMVRRRLRETSASLPDVDIDAEVAITVQQLVDRFVLVQQDGGYAGLMGLDQERFDTAAAILTAISMRFYRMKTVPIGEISSVRLNEHTFQFTSAQQKGEVSIEEQWLQEALISLGRVSRVQQQYAAAAASFKPFVVSGPTRHKHDLGHYETLMSGVLRLITDRWNDGSTAPDYYDGYGQI